MADEFTKAALYGIKTFNKKVKEKIGIEKLINLLNEFENEEADVNIRYWNYYQNGFHLLEYGQTYSEMLIISKKYEFIKWLVENDKINLYMLDSKAHNTDIIIELYKYENLKDKDSKRLLMLLSISDTPIDDLILYLK